MKLMKHCVVCEGHGPFRDKYPDIHIVECPACGHIFLDRELSDSDIQDLYSPGYFKGENLSHSNQEKDQNVLHSDYEKDRHIHQKNFKIRAAEILRHSQGGKLLEIGSAYGYFLDLIKENFDATGFEICPEAAAFARDKLGLNVYNEDFLQTEVKDQFDVVCMYDVIEHLKEPDVYIEKISRITRPGGFIYITTGDISAFLPRIQGRKWRLLLPPYHIHYFNPANISRLLNRYGFKVERIHYPGIWRSIHQAAASLLNWKSASRFIPGAFYINTFDIMEVRASRQ